MKKNKYLICFSVILLILESTYANAATGTMQDLGFIFNVGQWPSHVIAVSQRHGIDVWVTKTGVIIDEYHVKGSSRIGRVSEELFFGAVTDPVDGIEGSTLVSIFKDGVQNPFETFASRASAILFRFPSGQLLQVRHDYDGRVMRTFQNTPDWQAARANIIRRGFNENELDGIMDSQSFV